MRFTTLLSRVNAWRFAVSVAVMLYFASCSAVPNSKCTLLLPYMSSSILSTTEEKAEHFSCGLRAINFFVKCRSPETVKRWFDKNIGHKKIACFNTHAHVLNKGKTQIRIRRYTIRNHTSSACAAEVTRKARRHARVNATLSSLALPSLKGVKEKKST